MIVSISSFSYKRNLLLLSFGILLNMSAYLPLEAVQSSFNQTAGTSSLATVYLVAVLSSLFLAPLVITKFGSKRCLLAGMLSYMSYTLANFYPRDYTLIPAAALVGAGGAVMWPACLVYIVDLAKVQAKITRKDQNHLAANFFSIFYSIISCAYLAGMVLLSVLFSTHIEDTSSVKLNITSLNNYDIKVDTPLLPHAKRDFQCGVSFHNSQTISSEAMLPDVLLYIMLALFLIFHISGFLMCLCVDQVFETSFDGELNHVDNPELWEEESERPHTSESSTGLINLEIKKEKTNKNSQLNSQPSVLTLCKSVFTLVAKDKIVLLMMVNTLQIGMMQAFYRGEYNSAWVSCSHGIKYTAYTMVIYAAVTLTGSFSSVKLLKYMSFQQLFGVVAFLELSVFVVLAFWAPSPNTSAHESWPFFVISAILGFSKGVIKAQQPTVYNILFSEDKNVAATIQILWESIGISSIYLISTVSAPVVSTTIMICMVILGYILFILSFYIQDKNCRLWPCAAK